MMNYHETENQGRVERGAKLLDEKIPNWAERVNILDLDLGDPSSCVLGQVFADEDHYTGGLSALNLNNHELEPVHYGFESEQAVAGDRWTKEYEELRAYWAQEIRERRG